MSDDPPKATTLSASAISISMFSGRASATLQSPLPDQHPFYEKIGRVSALWARLEHQLDQMIWDLAKGERAALSCITGQIMGSSGRFRAIKALCELRQIPKELADNIKSMDHPILQTSLKRNRIVHDAWYHEVTDNQPTTQGQFRSQTYKDHDFGYEPISEEEIIDLLKRINAHLEVLYPLRQRLINALSP